MTIEFDIIPLKNQKPTEQLNGKITFHEKHIHYYVDFYADEPIDKDDRSLGWENIYNSFDIRFYVKNVAGTELSYSPTNKAWVVTFLISGFQKDIDVWFKKENDAKEFHKKVIEFLYEEKSITS